MSSFAEAFGADFVADPGELAALGATTYARDVPVSGRLVARDLEAVRRAVRLAPEAGVSLAPVSRGKNWGWGSSAPHAAGAVVLDLSKMDRILDFSDALGYVTVEPGVSVGALVELLDARGSTRALPMGGTTAEASLVGHLCERGISVGTVYHDRASHVCGLEAVLGDGHVVHTGMRRFGRGPVAATHRFGPGPGLESLLTQCDFAVITEATIWLPRRGVEPFLTLVATDDLAALVDALREAVGAGLRLAPQIYNRAKVDKMFFARRGPPVPLPPGAWIGLAPAYPGSARHAAADRAVLEERLAEVPGCRWAFLPLGDDSGPLAGRPYPTDDVLAGMLYRFGESRLGAGVDPQRDGCGIVWGCFAVPLAGVAVRAACAIAERAIGDAGFEVFLAVHPISERAGLLFPQLSFPRERAATAITVLASLSRALHAAGFTPARVPAGIGGVPQAPDDTDQIVDRIRDALDPRGALAAGKYRPAAD